MARQAFDNPALHVFYNRHFWFILPHGIIIMVLFLPVGHIFGRRHWRGCHIPDTMSEKNTSIRTRFCAPSGRFGSTGREDRHFHEGVCSG